MGKRGLGVGVAACVAALLFLVLASGAWALTTHEPELPFAQGQPAPPPAGLSPLNRHLLDRDLAGSETVSLACAGSGTGVTLSQLDALIVYGIQEAGLAGAAGWIQGWAEQHQLELKGENPGATLDQQVQERAKHLPLAQLGVTGAPPTA